MMMKTSELSGAALDWAVAKCEDYYIHPATVGAKIFVRFYEHESFWIFRPSVDWAQGGPIIGREKIELTDNGSGTSAWASSVRGRIGLCIATGYGPTALIAAMRCYVTSRLGEEVEIPVELCNG